jgi:hypothetical protein
MEHRKYKQADRCAVTKSGSFYWLGRSCTTINKKAERRLLRWRLRLSRYPAFRGSIFHLTNLGLLATTMHQHRPITLFHWHTHWALCSQTRKWLSCFFEGDSPLTSFSILQALGRCLHIALLQLFHLFDHVGLFRGRIERHSCQTNSRRGSSQSTLQPVRSNSPKLQLQLQRLWLYRFSSTIEEKLYQENSRQSAIFQDVLSTFLALASIMWYRGLCFYLVRSRARYTSQLSSLSSSQRSLWVGSDPWNSIEEQIRCQLSEINSWLAYGEEIIHPRSHERDTK